MLALRAAGAAVAPGGTLLVIATAREDDEGADGPPWPLTRAEIDAFGLDPVRVELIDGRWRAELAAT